MPYIYRLFFFYLLSVTIARLLRIGDDDWLLIEKKVRLFESLIFVSNLLWQLVWAFWSISFLRNFQTLLKHAEIVHFHLKIA